MTASPLPRPTSGRSGFWTEARVCVERLIPGAVLIWLVMCAVGYLLTHPLADAGFTRWEVGLDRWFSQHRSAGWNTITNIASLAGDTPAAIGISVVAFIVLRLVVGRWREPLVLAVSMIGEVGIFASTTIVVGRSRPTVAHLDGSPPTSSFPSGHTAASTTLYGVLAVIVFAHTSRAGLRALAVILATVIVLSIGMSRLYRGMHYPSDVAGGILLGLLWITVTTLVVLRRRTERAVRAEAVGANHG